MSKEAITSGLTAVISLVIIISLGFNYPFLSPVAAIVLTILGLTIVASLLAISLGLSRSGVNQLALIVAPALAVIIAGWFSISSLIAALFLLPILHSAGRGMRQEMADRVKYRARPIFLSGLRHIILGLLIAVIGFAFPLISQADSLEIKPDQLEVILKPLEPLLNQATDDIIDQQLDQQLPPGARISPSQRQQIRQQVTSSQASLAEQVADTINKYIRQITDQNPLLIPLIIIFSIFLTLRLAISWLAWPALLVTFILIHLALSSKLIQITTLNQPTQRLTY